MWATTGYSNVSADLTTAMVRVFLPTYRRHTLLPRAIESLRAQTLNKWICEVHNDDPTDDFPARLLERIGDSRLQLVQHSTNLGATASFNLFYGHVAEPFFSILEDDNSWEPDFLECMAATLDLHPEATLAWCNQHVVLETADGTLLPAGHCVQPQEPADAQSRAVQWGQWRQIMGAVHANGAMLMRSRPDTHHATPDVLFDCMEAFRERTFPHPLVYQPRALASFTVTRRSARGTDLGAWSAAQTAMAASFIRHASLSAAELHAVCDEARQQTPPMTSTLINAALICREARPLLRQLRWIDWLRYIKSGLRRPGTLWQALRVRQQHPDWWEFLDRNSARRFRDAAAITAGEHTS